MLSGTEFHGESESGLRIPEVLPNIAIGSQRSNNSRIDAFRYRISRGVRIRAPKPSIPAKGGPTLTLCPPPFRGPYSAGPARPARPSPAGPARLARLALAPQHYRGPQEGGHRGHFWPFLAGIPGFRARIRTPREILYRNASIPEFLDLCEGFSCFSALFGRNSGFPSPDSDSP